MNFNKKSEITNFYEDKDKFYWSEIEKLVKDHKISVKLILQNYLAFSQRRDLRQVLAYYELINKTINLPGSIAEFGVYLGNSLLTFAKLIEILCPSNGSKVFGFDNFKGYHQKLSIYDKKSSINYIKKIRGEGGDFKINYNIVEKLVGLHNLDQIIPATDRVKIYKGEFNKTFKEFKNENAGIRFKIISIDLNLYIPTIKVLNTFYNLMIPGGYILFRGYGVKPWEGESKAVDKFLKDKNIKNLGTFTFSPYPSLYCVV